MRRLALVVVLVIAYAGCKEVDPAYCVNPAHVDYLSCSDGVGGGSCKSSSDCTITLSFPVCDTADNGGTCAVCTADDHQLCTGTTPLCKNHACVACTSDSDCGTGGLCLPNGACAAPESIIHVALTNAAVSTPCGSGISPPCQLATALAAVDSTRNVIKLDEAGNYATGGSPNFIVNADVTIDARKAVLHRTVDGPILSISDNKTVTIYGGKIEGATGNTGDGILCNSGATLTVDGTTINMSDKSAINASSGCKLTVKRATISDSSRKGGPFAASILAGGDSVTLMQSRLQSNRGGGINVTSGTFVIVGNVLSNNGDVNSPNGGVTINTGPDPMNRMEFNSISGNHVQSGLYPGVGCTAGVGFIARNNIIWNNNDNIGSQIGGNCKHAYSDIGATGVTAFNDGGNNLSLDPMFTSEFHVMSSSMVLKKADPNASLNGVAERDIDGDLRVAPADIGADQVPRP